jgi:hypothetical protein
MTADEWAAQQREKWKMFIEPTPVTRDNYEASLHQISRSPSTASPEPAGEPTEKPSGEWPSMLSIVEPLDTLSISTGYGFEVTTCGGQPGFPTVTWY